MYHFFPAYRLSHTGYTGCTHCLNGIDGLLQERAEPEAWREQVRAKYKELGYGAQERLCHAVGLFSAACMGCCRTELSWRRGGSK